MKKLLLISIFILGLILSACTNKESAINTEGDNVTQESDNKEVSQNKSKLTADQNQQEPMQENYFANYIDTYILDSKYKIEKIINEKNPQILSDGVITYTIKNVNLITLQPSVDMEDLFYNRDTVTLIGFELLTENTSNEIVETYPEYSVLTTNTGEQVDSDLMMTTIFGGGKKYYPGVKRDGHVIYQLETPAQDINSINIYFDMPVFNDNRDLLTIEDVVFTFSF